MTTITQTTTIHIPATTCMSMIAKIITTAVNAIAIKNGHTNGELEDAKKECDAIDKELNEFLIENAVKKVNKS